MVVSGNEQRRLVTLSTTVSPMRRALLYMLFLALLSLSELAAAPSTVLLVMVNNHNSIVPGGGDPRFYTLLAAAHEMKRRGHTVRIEGAGILSQKRFKAYPREREAHKLRPFRWLRAGEQPDLIVCWWNYLHDRQHTYQNRNVVRLLHNASIPKLFYENGMTKGAVTVDPKGLLGDSFYVQSLNTLAQQTPDDEPCAALIAHHLRYDSSKRPQSSLVDVPLSMDGRFVFVPTQKFTDASVLRHSNITYPVLLNEVAHFCKQHTLPLVIKIHPHVS